MTKLSFHTLLGAAGNSSSAAFVRFTTTGSTFAPIIALSGGSSATVNWLVEETQATATGLTPNINFGSPATRHVQMSATGGGKLTDVIQINLGYDHTQDAGTYSLDGTYDLASQGVTAVENLNRVYNLVRFMAAQTTGTSAAPLTSSLNFSGFSSLQHIELFNSSVPSITLTGCTSLVRLCLEANKLTTIDLNPVASNLYDFRCAIQQGGSLALTPLTSDMPHLYHFCIRDQTITGMPSFSRLPAIQQLWIWNTGQTGAFTVNSTNSVLQSAEVFGNAWSSVSLSGATAMTDILFNGCSFNSATVDSILSTVDSFNTSSGTLNVSSNASPTNTGGQQHITQLRNRSWTVSFNSIWEDTFNRADATGLVAVNNGWVASVGSPTANISGNDLVRTETSGYTAITNPATGTLPADYTVTVRIPGTTLGTFFGIVGRWATNDGIQAFFNNNYTSFSDLNLAHASGYLVSPATLTADNAFPASWTNTSIDHTFALQMIGTTCNILLDGVLVAHGTIDINTATTGTSVGICGEGQNRHWHDICVT